jgi:hypothetical protein
LVTTETDRVHFRLPAATHGYADPLPAIEALRHETCYSLRGVRPLNPLLEL